jgi:multidrug efflux pump subunit AcrA (membrane-fusion protein)
MTINEAPKGQDAPKMTAVFDFDLRQYQGNPHHADTPFGKPVILAMGDELTAAQARIEKQVRFLKIARDEAGEALARAEQAEAEVERLKADQAQGREDYTALMQRHDEQFVACQIAMDQAKTAQAEVKRLRGVMGEVLSKLDRDGAKPGWGVVRDWLRAALREGGE